MLRYNWHAFTQSAQYERVKSYELLRIFPIREMLSETGIHFLQMDMVTSSSAVADFYCIPGLPAQKL
jgi:hypothetical protein